jgi:hypothetical protein
MCSFSSRAHLRAESKDCCICYCRNDENERDTNVNVVDEWMPIGRSGYAGRAIAMVRNIIGPRSKAGSEDTKVTNEKYSPDSYEEKSHVAFQTTFVEDTCTSCAI